MLCLLICVHHFQRVTPCLSTQRCADDPTSHAHPLSGSQTCMYGLFWKTFFETRPTLAVETVLGPTSARTTIIPPVQNPGSPRKKRRETLQCSVCFLDADRILNRFETSGGRGPTSNFFQLFSPDCMSHMFTSPVDVLARQKFPHAEIHTACAHNPSIKTRWLRGLNCTPRRTPHRWTAPLLFFVKPERVLPGFLVN